jgi:ribosomal-protein-alanine N-acetyltransferase
MSPPETLPLPRLLLRRPQLADAPALFACGSDPEVARYMDWPRATTIEPSIERLRRSDERWAAGNYYWVITLPAEDHAVIGAISCSVEDHSAEFGFFLHPRHWGHGYATEAARAIVDSALAQPAIARVWATCDAENLASMRVLEKAGLSRERLLPRAIVRPNLSPEPRDAILYARVSAS